MDFYRHRSGEDPAKIGGPRKPALQPSESIGFNGDLSTRWGTQLNGNIELCRKIFPGMEWIEGEDWPCWQGKAGRFVVILEDWDNRYLVSLEIEGCDPCLARILFDKRYGVEEALVYIKERGEQLLNQLPEIVRSN